jgi:hypothetical protein
MLLLLTGASGVGKSTVREAIAPQTHMPHVLTADGWPGMRWDRWLDRRRGDPSWNVATIDTSRNPFEETAAAVLAWVRASLRGETPRLSVSAAASPDS